MSGDRAAVAGEWSMTPDAASPNSVTWSDESAAMFLDLIDTERQRLARQRFAGSDPALRGPSGARASRTIARILAADRDGALVQAGEMLINPAEDRAEAALQQAVNALSTWDFVAARRELGIAAAAARVPVRQQRISVLRGLVTLVRALVLMPPGERLHGEDRSARGLVLKADQLPDAERDYDLAEIERLLAAWREAATDDTGWQAWAVLRGRLALRDGADESVLAWALRAWQRQPVEQQAAAEPALAAQLEQTRGYFRALADDVAAEEDGATAPPRASDVLLGVASALAAAIGAGEPFAPTMRFSFMPYHPPRPPDEQEVAT